MANHPLDLTENSTNELDNAASNPISVAETVSNQIANDQKKSTQVEPEGEIIPKENMNLLENPNESQTVVLVDEKTLSMEKPTEDQMTELAEPHETAHENPMAIEPILELEHPSVEVDYSSFEKKDLVDLAEKLLASIKGKEGVSISDIRNADNVLKEIKPIFDDLKAVEKINARKKYVAENGSDEGFDYKNDNYTIRFESLAVQIRETKNAYFHKLEREREGNFETKTQLLQKLRELVEGEEANQGKDNWKKFKQIQEDWKAAGNISSPHNSSLWSAYSALVDRYFSFRHIQNELKDLDRKKNFAQKTELVEKIEAISNSIEINGLTGSTLKHANDLLEEYKHIGPAQREAQEALWQRLKAAFDVIYGKRREQNQSANALQEEVLAAKSRLFENLKPFTEFNSDSINEWNAKSKEVMAIQEQWNTIKGAMPKDKGKDLSRDFWAGLKTFFQNKGEFFRKLEADREENLKAKTNLCEQVEAFVAENISTPEATDKVIEFQKTWRTIGHVPEKYKDKIFDRFKKSCDAFFNAKRNKNNDIEKEYEENLKKKIALCEQIEVASQNAPDLAKLPELKAEFNAIGYVPRKEMQNIQRRFVDAINTFVKASTGVSGAEKEKMVLQNEVEVVMKGDKAGSKNLDKKEVDVRRKLKTLEDDIALWRNNLEFFARSKNADALKADFEKKIQSAENEVISLKQQLKIIVAVN